MGRRWAGAPVVALALLVARPGDAQTIQAGELTLDFTGRAQVQFSTTSVDEEDLLVPADEPAATAFETRRLYFGAEFAFQDWITGILEADLAGEAVELTDGYIELALASALSVRAGQFKKPFGLIELTSDTRTPTIERSQRIRGLEDVVLVPAEEQYLLDESLYVGRQIGVQVHGAAGRLAYAAGVFNGEGANRREVESSKAYAGRLTYRALERLVVGAAGSVQPSGRFNADGDEMQAVAWSLEGEYGGFREPGLHVLGEAMVGDNPLLFPVLETEMAGLHVMAGWFAPLDGRVEGVEPLLRVSWADPDLDGEDDAGMLVTPGINAYFSGRNRVQLNADIYLPSQDGVDTEYALVAQLQIHF